MKTKLEMAHEYAIALINSDSEMQFDKFIRLCWNYADAMQAESDKRMVKLPDVFFDTKQNEEWQPDWSVAPERATAWKIGDHGVAMWLQSHNNPNQPYVWLSDAPSFNYQGNWQDSLRKRPQ